MRNAPVTERIAGALDQLAQVQGDLAGLQHILQSIEDRQQEHLENHDPKFAELKIVFKARIGLARAVRHFLFPPDPAAQAAAAVNLKGLAGQIKVDWNRGEM